VCLRNLGDLQLALVIVRLYESDIESINNLVKSLLCVEILGYKTEPVVESTSSSGGGNGLGQISKHPDPKRISTDPFLRSMSYWALKDYKLALHTLFEIDVTTNNPMYRKDHSIISHVFNFYTFLKRHPLVLKQQQLINGEGVEAGGGGGCREEVTPVERRLHFVTAYYHLINGCPLLALDVLSKLPKYICTGGGGIRLGSNEASKEKLDNGNLPINSRKKIKSRIKITNLN
jgi:hypothetical protein